jgi:flagellar biosynthesis GTPase FlhF
MATTTLPTTALPVTTKPTTTMPTETRQPQIRVKSYFANSVPDAIEVARRELGPDALLLTSRRAPPEASHLGPIEVVFGESANSRAAEPQPPVVPQPGEITDLHRKMDEIRALLVRTGGNNAYREARRRVVEKVLLDAGLTATLAAEIDEAVAQRVSRRAVLDISRPRAGTRYRLCDAGDDGRDP